MSQELATIGELVQIIAEDVHTANENEVPRAAQQIDETLARLIDQRIAKALCEHGAVKQSDITTIAQSMLKQDGNRLILVSPPSLGGAPIILHEYRDVETAERVVPSLQSVVSEWLAGYSVRIPVQ